MLKNIMKTTLAMAILASGLQAASAESVDVKVIGTIVPTACTPTVSGGGVIDYGNIKATTLKADAYTVLPLKTVDFSISCDAPAKVAIAAKNGRFGSLAGASENSTTGVAPAPVTLPDMPGSGAVGLGLDGTTKIGGYSMEIKEGTTTADGELVASLYTNGSLSAGWSQVPAGKGDVYNMASQRYMSWGKTGTLDPIAFKALAGKLAVQAYINKASELDLTHAIHLDGLTTLEVFYL